MEYNKKIIGCYSHGRLEVFAGERHRFTDVGNLRAMEMTIAFVEDNLD